MRRSSIFWGSLLLLFGILLLLSNLGILAINVWAVFWPLVLILIGLRMLWGFSFGRQQLHQQELTLPLEDYSQAEFEVHHGAGRLNINGMTAPNNLLLGQFNGGVEHQISRIGTTAHVRLSAPTVFFPWDWTPFMTSQGLTWDINLNPNLPLKLDLRTGASENILDLSGLKVTDFRLDTGASSTNITFPANAGQTYARIHTGAAGLKIRIPDGVAAHIEVKSGMAGININPTRFPHSASGYESPDYAASTNRADIHIETGVGSVDIL